jgi:hypothetical protein
MANGFSALIRRTTLKLFNYLYSMMDQTRIGYYYWQQPMTNRLAPFGIFGSCTQVFSKHARGESCTKQETSLGRSHENCAGRYSWSVVSSSNVAFSWGSRHNIICDPRPGAQGFSCPPPSISLDNFSPITNRYIDIGAGGPAPFTFTVSSNVSWVGLSVTKGNISPESPEQRVYVSVTDWNELNDGANSAQVTFKATASGQPPMSLVLTVNAQMNSVTEGFKGS